jgi:hypothetical protein
MEQQWRDYITAEAAADYPSASLLFTSAAEVQTEQARCPDPSGYRTCPAYDEGWWPDFDALPTCDGERSPVICDHPTCRR